MRAVAKICQEARVAYARLLDEHPVESYGRAPEALEQPLGRLLYSLYEGHHARLPIEVDRFRDQGCVFLYDSGGEYLKGGVNRLVGAIACSRERVGFDELLRRLREERDR
ncbi:MAG TPA: hypothetical protein VHQ90_20580 [Thermoanaerobaculia bacterium]|nr:hypothetical protein [Thermoanaerobaculia bacterium]